MINFFKKHKNEFIVGIICSLFVSAIFYALGLQKVDMRYTLQTIPIANTWNDNSLQYNNAAIDNMSLTIVTITNKGNKALNGNTMLKKAPLTVSLAKNFKILSIMYNQDRKTSTDLDYSLVADNNNITIPFEVLNPNDTLRFSIIHTGYSSDNFSITGNWENGNGIKDDTIIIETVKNTFNFITMILTALAGMLMSIFVTIKDVNNRTKINYAKILEALEMKSEEINNV